MHFELLAHDYELRFGSIQNVRELPACSRLQSQLAEHILTLSRISKLLESFGIFGEESVGTEID